MQAPAGCRQVSYEGRVYRVSEDGTLEVPEAARAELEEHGFARVREPRKRVRPRARKPKEQDRVAQGDLTTLANVKAWFAPPLTTTADDALLTRLITAASQVILTCLDRYAV